jgi:hypothetical protein
MLLFQSFRHPLFEHALIIEIALTRQTLQAGKHPRVHPESDGGRFIGIGADERALYQAQADLMAFPKLGLFVQVGEKGGGIPIVDNREARLEVLLALALVKISLFLSHQPGGNDADDFSGRGINGKDRRPFIVAAEAEKAVLRGESVRIGQ